MRGCLVSRLFVLVLSLACGARAVAQVSSSTPVHIEESSCRSVPRTTLEAALRVELGARVIDKAEPLALRVRISCPRGHAVAVVTRPDGGRSELRTQLHGVRDDVRPRVVALTLAEIVRALERTPPPPEPPPPAPRVEPPLAAELPAPRPPPALRVSALAHAESFGRMSSWLAGGGLGLAHVWSELELAADAVVLTSERDTARGSARTLATHLRPALVWRRPAGLWSSRLGAGAAIGYARIAGQASAENTRAGSVSGPWLAPHALVGGSYCLARWLELTASVELGWVLVPLRGEIQGSRDVRLAGPWAALSVGVARPF